MANVNCCQSTIWRSTNVGLWSSQPFYRISAARRKLTGKDEHTAMREDSGLF